MALDIFGRVPGFYKNWKCHEDAFKIVKTICLHINFSIAFFDFSFNITPF